LTSGASSSIVTTVRTLRVIGTIAVGLVAGFALALLLPLVKEGYGTEDLPHLARVAAALGVLAAGWWLVNGRRHRRTGLAGVALLAAPLLLYTTMAIRVVQRRARGRRLAGTVHVIALRETPLRFAGIAEPVGVRMEVEFDQAVALEGNLFAPKVVMAADPRPTADEYFAIDATDEAVLTPPVFELARQPPRDVIARAGRTRIVYDLLPGSIKRRDGEAVCLDAAGAAPSTPSATSGSHLGAAWLFAAAGGERVDLGPALTEALRRSSAYEGRPAAWTALLDATRPEALARAGYTPCLSPPPGGERCLCPSPLRP